MDVAISTLRAELSTWIERARSGEEIVVTERGTPVARLLAVDAAPLLDQLIASGVLSKPRREDRPRRGVRLPPHCGTAAMRQCPAASRIRRCVPH
jgi:prevent-host-death family protein